jgi:hypothetical protein
MFVGNNVFRGNFTFSVRYINNGGYETTPTDFLLQNSGNTINANYKSYYSA